MRSPRVRFLIAAASLAFAAGCTIDAVAPTAPPTVVLAPIHRASLLDPGAIRTIYGPTTFTRSTGTPVTSTFTLSGFGAVATLTVVNGDAQGNHRVTSATVSVDGAEVVHESQFGKKVATIVTPVTLGNSSTVSIRIASSPGDFITVSVDGTLATSGAVPPTGGVVHLLGEQVTLGVPAGAVSQPVTLTAEPAPAPSPEAAPGTIIELGPTGTTFSTPITLSIAFDPAMLPAGAKPASLHMYFWNVDHWEALPNSTVDMVHGVVTATTTHFTTFALLPNEVEFCQSDPTSEQSLQTAISHVPSGGRVFVCDGVNYAQMVTIDRPVTIQAEHAGLGIIAQPDTASTGTYVLQLLNVPSGTVALTDLAINFRTRGFLAHGTYDQVVITGTTFRGFNPAVSVVGAVFDQTSVPTAHVTIDHDEFTASSQGLLDSQPVDIDVTYCNFHDLGTFGLLLYSANSTGSFPANGAVPPGFSPKSATAHVEWNTFHNCGNSVCIAVEQASHGTVRHNSIVMDTGSVVDAILLNRIGQLPGLTAQLLVTDNSVTGHGPAAGADSTLQASWGVRFALRVLSGPTVVSDSFARNTINTAFVALDMRAPNRPIVTDNQISNVYTAVNINNSSGVGIPAGNFDGIELHRNDISNYHYPIATNMLSVPLVPLAVAAIPGRLTCNYWGSASGPTGVIAGTPVTSYTAFSAVPIAEQPGVICDPAPSMTVRACPTPGGSVPTLPTIPEAFANIPTGGTILVCDGTFTVNQLTVNRSVTFTAEGPGMPTIDADGNLRAFNVISVAGGPVAFSRLRFTGGTSSQVSVGTNAGTVSFTQNEFHPSQTNPYGVQPFGGRTGIFAGAPGLGTITIDHNAFIGGDIGLQVGGGTGSIFVITNNTFSSLVLFPVSIGQSTAFASSILVDHNSFTDCSVSSCVFVGQPATITNNTFTARIARPVFDFVRVQTGISGSPAATLISGNSMVAADIGAGSRASTSTFAVTQAVSVFSGTAQVTNNTITRAYKGVMAGASGGVSGAVTVTDNVITTVSNPFGGTGQLNSAAVLIANWNDLTDYTFGFGTIVSLNVGALNVRCNWWGSAAGPVNMQPGVPVGAYTPFAAASVAGGSHTGCSP